MEPQCSTFGTKQMVLTGPRGARYIWLVLGQVKHSNLPSAGAVQLGVNCIVRACLY